MTDCEKAVLAYQFQVERYHTWMNYYSLFNGALFVALYSIGDFSSNHGKNFLFLIIAFVGYIAGLCWLGTVIGNRKWIDNWIRIVQVEEKKDGKSLYSQIYSNGTQRGFLSTQKIMQFFVGFVTLAWLIVVLKFTIMIEECSGCQFMKLFIGALVVVITITAIVMYYCGCNCIYSNINNMDIKN